MKKLEILQQLPKCDTETQSEQIHWWNDTDELNAGIPQNFIL